jgi:putative pyruvate formate lyase activating enzyme
MMDYYKRCLLCPRRCGVNRTAGERGYCGESAELRLASASIHRGEEPPITGVGGSGAIFVSGCNLGCVFCQNYQISHEGMGQAMSIEELCLKLQAMGAENINIVTGTHAIPAIVAGLTQARASGLVIPALWNTSAYESPEALALLDEVIDVYLPDLKTLDPGLAARFFNAPDYPEHAQNAILRMLDTRKLSGSAIALSAPLTSGVIIRHLALPGHLEATREVLRWFAEHCQGRALISVMTQYTPSGGANSGAKDARAKDAPERFMSEQEYETVLGWLEEFGIDDGFYQELTPDSDWLPDFTRPNPFSSTLSTAVWHWKESAVGADNYLPPRR